MVILQLAISLDGYIAKADGSVDFLGNMDTDVNNMFEEFVQSIDHIVMGRTTYNQMVTFGDIPFPDKHIIVLSSQELSHHPSHVVRMNASIPEVVSSLEGNIWLFGGAHVIRSFFQHNLVDRLELFIVPHILGDGISLFDDVPELSELTLKSVQSYGDNVLLVYENTSNR